MTASAREADRDSPERKAKRKNRKPYERKNWASLYREFQRSAMSRDQFLIARKMDPKNPTVKKHTQHWEAAGKIEEESVKAETLKVGIEKFDSQDVDSIWQAIQNWRREVSRKHYAVSHLALVHAEILLNRGFMRTKNSNGEDVVTTELSPRELKALVSTLGEVQRIQRLSLGLTTDNPGIPDPTVGEGDGSHVEHELPEANEGPVFVVEVNRNGKFVKARPRQLVAPARAKAD